MDAPRILAPWQLGWCEQYSRPHPARQLDFATASQPAMISTSCSPPSHRPSPSGLAPRAARQPAAPAPVPPGAGRSASPPNTAPWPSTPAKA